MLASLLGLLVKLIPPRHCLPAYALCRLQYCISLYAVSDTDYYKQASVSDVCTIIGQTWWIFEKYNGGFDLHCQNIVHTHV